MPKPPFKYKNPFPTRSLLFFAAYSVLMAGVLVTTTPMIDSIWLVPGYLKQCFEYAQQLIVYAREAGISAFLAVVDPFPLYPVLAITPFPIVAFASFLPVIQYVSVDPNQPRMAKLIDIKNMELLGRLGPTLASFKGHALRPMETLHALFFASTRSGKSVQIVSTILDYPGSIVAVEPKGNIKIIVGPDRASKGPFFELSVANPHTKAGWNFLALSKIPTENHDRELYAARVAGLIVPEKPEVKDPHWDDNARRNLTATFLFEMSEAVRLGRDGHPYNVWKLWNDLPPPKSKKDDPFVNRLNWMVKTSREHNYPSFIVDALSAFAKTLGAGEATSHISTFNTKMAPFAYEATRRFFGLDSFDFDLLRKKPTSVFIDFPQEDAPTFGRLTALFLDAVIAWSLSNPRKPGDLPILIIIDEMRDLPAIELLPSFLNKAAGYGVHILISVQTSKQIQERYPNSYHNFMVNFDHYVLFDQPDQEMQDKFARLVGKVKKTKQSKNRKGLGFASSTTDSEHSEDLISPQMWGTIPKGKCIVLSRRHFIRPILCDVTQWFKLPQYLKKVPKPNRIKT
ncbi:type IV secretory system conjugative DNA transfer family protein [Aestuariispira insulae]|uniref:Type IV secretory pathway TraG/TraD family ATPase VirD4 n=1 Tax=Aestuariispira insulae TaxID=1461337 RepID=A0A3D9H3S0_9PROT|nr:type IV secretory system conjugative DNA transfer family protein [Aestuariispira insulae]RED44112.1 type IV secretory pathway TraG/TraD family ATPase VirD4 [Aestuariispira insulae]